MQNFLAISLPQLCAAFISIQTCIHYENPSITLVSQNNSRQIRPEFFSLSTKRGLFPNATPPKKRNTPRQYSRDRSRIVLPGEFRRSNLCPSVQSVDSSNRATPTERHPSTSIARTVAPRHSCSVANHNKKSRPLHFRDFADRVHYAQMDCEPSWLAQCND